VVACATLAARARATATAPTDCARHLLVHSSFMNERRSRKSAWKWENKNWSLSFRPYRQPKHAFSLHVIFISKKRLKIMAPCTGFCGTSVCWRKLDDCVQKGRWFYSNLKSHILKQKLVVVKTFPTIGNA
jgi:hypothetical protein